MAEVPGISIKLAREVVEFLKSRESSRGGAKVAEEDQPF